MSLALISGLASVVPELTAQFNSKYQDNQLGIAQANARAAEAAAVASRSAQNDDQQKKMIIGVVIAIVVIGIIWKITQ